MVNKILLLQCLDMCAGDKEATAGSCMGGCVPSVLCSIACARTPCQASADTASPWILISSLHQFASHYDAYFCMCAMQGGSNQKRTGRHAAE